MPAERAHIQVGRRIKEQREYLDLTQTELADTTAIPRSAISQIELGNRKVTTDEVYQLSVALHCSLDYLVSGKESEIPEEVMHLARAAGKLTDEDRAELLKFADFLSHKVGSKK